MPRGRHLAILTTALMGSSAACLLPALDTLSDGDASIATDGSVSTDGSPVDGATVTDGGASDAPNPNIMRCPKSNVQCTSGTEMCCLGASSWQCVAASTPQCPNDAGEFRCDSDLQCDAGSVCCIVTVGITNLSRPSTKCVPAGTCTDGRQLCHSSAECDGGKQCKPEPMISWPLACRF